MTFGDVIRTLGATRVIAIITHRADGSPTVTPIWSVVIDGAPYVRSAYGPGSRWYRYAISGREVRVALADGSLAERDRQAALGLPSEVVRVEHVSVSDPIQSAIDEAIRAKYSSEPSSVEETVTEKAVGSTLRVIPGD